VTQPVKQKRSHKRGYPVALLIGFEADRAVLWQVFSNLARLYLKIELTGRRTDEKALYNFHESVIDALKPTIREGIRSIVVTSPIKTTYATDFLNHTRKHHTYLTQSKSANRTNFSQLTGSTDQAHKVAELVKTKQFHRLITETISGEADQIISTLEKNLFGVDGDSIVLYSLKEIEDTVYNREKHNNLRTGYLILTDKYLADCKDKNRIQRLLQISKNSKIRTRIMNAETPAGKRITQFGGLIFFTAATR
jgi:stalled ribosome rescue protein Dom34